MAKQTSKSTKVSRKKVTAKTSTRNGAWFIRTRGSYLPASTAGWLAYIPFIGYLVFSAVAGLQKTDSLAEAILFIVPNWIAAAVATTYVASRKS